MNRVYCLFGKYCIQIVIFILFIFNYAIANNEQDNTAPAPQENETTPIFNSAIEPVFKTSIEENKTNTGSHESAPFSAEIHENPLPAKPPRHPVQKLTGIYNQAELLVVNDLSQNNIYITTLQSGGTVLNGALPPVVYGVREPLAIPS